MGTTIEQSIIILITYAVCVQTLRYCVFYIYMWNKCVYAAAVADSSKTIAMESECVLVIIYLGMHYSSAYEQYFHLCFQCVLSDH